MYGIHSHCPLVYEAIATKCIAMRLYKRYIYGKLKSNNKKDCRIKTGD